jgi:hypothetical protein
MAIDAISRTLCVKAAAINATRENNQISSANDGDTINQPQLIYMQNSGPSTRSTFLPLKTSMHETRWQRLNSQPKGLNKIHTTSKKAVI